MGNVVRPIYSANSALPRPKLPLEIPPAHGGWVVRPGVCRGGESPAPQVLHGDVLCGCLEPLTGQEIIAARGVSRISNVFMTSGKGSDIQD